MCKKCLGIFLLFLVLVGFGFFIIFKNAKGATVSPIINEIAWAGSITSANDEWIELYNPSDEAIILKGWKLEAADSSPSITLEGELPPGGYFLLERTDDTSVPNIKANQIYSGSLDNKGEDLKLIDSRGVMRDEVNASQGWPAGDNETKATMARDDANFTTANWGNGPINGTPLAKNILVSTLPKQSDAAIQSPMPTKQIAAKQKQASSATLMQAAVPVQPRTKEVSSAAPTAADIAAFNMRVQEATKDNSPFADVKNAVGAFALLGIGALATYTIIKRKKKDAMEE